ncbi:hypothetical protein [Vibrio cholerae]|uniref:hypothetical protein n=1 Tax=Vibrio cholerae TaxID=666 RepID=UPI0039C8E22E
MKKKIAINIDLVCTKDLGIDWYEYLVSNHGDYFYDESYERFCKDVENNQVDYNIAKYFDLPWWVYSMAFWKQEDLYDKEVLAESCYDVVKNLWQAGFEIYFLSHTTFEHIHSKYRFLQRNFDFLYESGDLHFVASKSKCCMGGSAAIIIDDRISNLNMFKHVDTLRILYDTPYRQDVVSTEEYVVAKSWVDIEDIICKWMEEE